MKKFQSYNCLKYTLLILLSVLAYSSSYACAGAGAGAAAPVGADDHPREGVFYRISNRSCQEQKKPAFLDASRDWEKGVYTSNNTEHTADYQNTRWTLVKVGEYFKLLNHYYLAQGAGARLDSYSCHGGAYMSPYECDNVLWSFQRIGDTKFYHIVNKYHATTGQAAGSLNKGFLRIHPTSPVDWHAGGSHVDTWNLRPDGRILEPTAESKMWGEWELTPCCDYTLPYAIGALFYDRSLYDSFLDATHRVPTFIANSVFRNPAPSTITETFETTHTQRNSMSWGFEEVRAFDFLTKKGSYKGIYAVDTGAHTTAVDAGGGINFLGFRAGADVKDVSERRWYREAAERWSAEFTERWHEKYTEVRDFTVENEEITRIASSITVPPYCSIEATRTIQEARNVMAKFSVPVKIMGIIHSTAGEETMSMLMITSLLKELGMVSELVRVDDHAVGTMVKGVHSAILGFDTEFSTKPI